MHTDTISSLTERYRGLNLPFIRGIVTLFETFYFGFKALYFSANAALEGDEQFTYKEFTVAIALALLLISFFFTIPFLLTSLLNLSGWIFNLVEALIRFSLFTLYLVLISKWGEFQRVLQYHGAEHKTINAFEAGATLDLESVKKFSRLHPRCGTSFIFIVLAVSILLFSIMPNLGFIVRFAYRIILIPVIAAISYELLKYSGKHQNSSITRILTLPGLALQRLTTREPADDMIEVAVKAVEGINKLNDVIQT